MGKSFLLLFALLSMVYYAGRVEAAFLVEPYAGIYVNSTYDVDGSSDGDQTGTSIGAKVGFTEMGVSVGLNGQRSSLNFEPETGSDADFTFTRLGAFVGYDFPMMFRVWGEYVFSLQGTDADDTDSKYLEGSGMAFGFGYKVLPFVSVNLEMANLATSKYETTLLEGDLDISYSTYLLSISLPFSI